MSNGFSRTVGAGRAVETHLFLKDLSDDMYTHFLGGGTVAWDIETSGLDWSKERIATCQLYRPRGIAALVRIHDGVPPNLARLLGTPKVKKVFHHATFDLRFLAFHWGCEIKNVACTKIASKILTIDPQSSHKLQDLLSLHLGVDIPKGFAKSNWFSSELSTDQLSYAFDDVLFLPRLLATLKRDLKAANKWKLALASFHYLPTRVQLDIQRSGDVFTY